MKTIAPILGVFLLIGLAVVLVPRFDAHAENPKMIDLGSSEKAKAMAILERRQAVYVKRQKIDAQYKADVDRLDEEIGEINIDAGQLCFELKKAHKIEPGQTYSLDEVNARLVKQ